jgi:hypothetical protein
MGWGQEVVSRGTAKEPSAGRLTGLERRGDFGISGLFFSAVRAGEKDAAHGGIEEETR